MEKEIKLDDSWYNKMCGSREKVHKLSYLDGASDFQRIALKRLEKFITDNNLTTQDNYLNGVIRSIEIIENLKAE